MITNTNQDKQKLREFKSAWKSGMRKIYGTEWTKKTHFKLSTSGKHLTQSRFST